MVLLNFLIDFILILFGHVDFITALVLISYVMDNKPTLTEFIHLLIIK